MPKVSEFYGISIVFYLHDHGVPHFHAFYGGARASVRIQPIEFLEGSLPPRAARLVFEWVPLHESELLACGRDIRAGRLPSPVPPLD